MRDGALRFLFDARVPARDGVELSCDIYLPDAEGPFPTILQRTPYDNSNPALTATAQYFARRGYAFVAADVRGRGDSDGRFTPFRGEGPDGYDTIEWIARQGWSDGKVGMMGGSYASSVQWVAARLRPPHLVTMVSTATSGRQVQDPVRRGKLRLSQFMWLHAVGGHTMQFGKSAADGGPDIDWQRILTHRPLRDMDIVLGRTNTAWRDWIANRDNDEFWTEEDQYHSFDQVDIPVLHITGWYDGSVIGELETYAGMARDSPAGRHQRLLIGPWDHAGTRTPQRRLGHRDFGEESRVDINALHLRWFDHWMRGIATGLEHEAPVKIFVMGSNRWREHRSWPAGETRQVAYYLHSAGAANGADGDGLLSVAAPTDEPTDGYRYDPSDPTPSAPQIGEIAWGSGALDHLDHGFAEDRQDVLVYTGPPMPEDLEVVGAPMVRLWAQSDAVDTDFAAVLCDVDPLGRSTILAEGLVRASYRDPGKRLDLLVPGQLVEYCITMNPTGHVFLAGHRIRLCISSAQFPAYDRNPNTGRSVADDDQMVVAGQTVHHSAAAPSVLLLPLADLSEGVASEV